LEKLDELSGILDIKALLEIAEPKGLAENRA